MREEDAPAVPGIPALQQSRSDAHPLSLDQVANSLAIHGFGGDEASPRMLAVAAVAHASQSFHAMRALQHSRATDDSWDEVTQRREALAVSREISSDADGEGWAVDVDDAWDEPAPLGFCIDGAHPAVVRLWRDRSNVTEAQGVVKRIEEDRLLLGTPGTCSYEVALSYRLPASVDLRALVGRRVRLTLVDELARGAARVPEQTLTISTQDGRVWLIARQGSARDLTHTLEGGEVRVMLSQKEGGPLVVAPPDLKHIVAPGGEAHLRVGKHRFVVELVSRDDRGRAAYFIADELLWH
jgi:hypothetical protein